MAERKRNPFGKRRPVTQPYAVYQAGDWNWRVLKTYQRPDKEEGNGYARWLCAVSSPFVKGLEIGDVYVNEIRMTGAELMSATDEWYEHYV